MPLRKITYLDGIRLHCALAAGVRRVLSRQDHLNRINVFPVPDGDTGTDLSFTLISILDNTGQRVQVHAGPGSPIMALQTVEPA